MYQKQVGNKQSRLQTPVLPQSTIPDQPNLWLQMTPLQQQQLAHYLAQLIQRILCQGKEKQEAHHERE